MLLVDDRETEILVCDLLLEDGMSSDEDVDRAVRQAHQHGFSRLALLATGEDGDPHSHAVELSKQGRMMLASEYFRRREQGRLRSGFNRSQHGHERNQR